MNSDDGQPSRAPQGRGRPVFRIEFSRIILILGIAIFLLGAGTFVFKGLTGPEGRKEPLEMPGRSVYGAFSSVLDVIQGRLFPKRDVVPERQKRYNEVFVALVLEHLSPGERAALEEGVGTLRDYASTVFTIEFWLIVLLLAILYYFFDKRLKIG